MLTQPKKNAAKTMSKRMNMRNAQPIEIEGPVADEVENFVYLGATVCQTGGT
jgi:hypothetical protein